jgi:hypothetical protein
MASEAGGQGLVVAGETSVKHEPAVGPFDRPPFRDRCESPGPGGAGGDFHVDAEGGGVFDEVLAVAAVDPHLADAGVFGGDLVQEPGAGDGVLHIAAVTSAASRRPRVSVTMFRFLPTIFFPASTP